MIDILCNFFLHLNLCYSHKNNGYTGWHSVSLQHRTLRHIVEKYWIEK